MDELKSLNLNQKNNFTRRSKIYLFVPVLFFLSSFFIILFLLYVINLYITSKIVLESTIIIATVFYFILTTYAFREWLKFNYDILLISRRDLLQIEQDGLLNRRILKIPLREILDVSVEIETFDQSLLNFGTITIEFKDQVFIFPMIPNPSLFAQKIIKAHNLEAKADPQATQMVILDENISLTQKNLTTEASSKPLNEPHLTEKEIIYTGKHPNKRDVQIKEKPVQTRTRAVENKKSKSWWDIFWESLIGR